jgi:MFS family permease
MLKALIRIYREAYRGLPRAAWMLAAAAFVNSSGTMVIFFLSLYLTQKLGFSTSFAGQALSLYGLGGVGGAYLGGWLCDKIGANRVQGMSLLLTGGLCVSLGFFQSRPAILILLAAIGLASQALYPANSTAMTLICPPELRPRGFSLQRLANNLGVTIGPVLGGYLALHNYHYLFWVDGLTSIAAAVLIVLFFRRTPIYTPAQEKSQQQQVSPWKDPLFLVILVLTISLGVIFVQLLSTYPLYLRRTYGLAENRIGSVLAVNTLMIVFLEMPLVHWLSRFAPGRVVAWGALFFGASFPLLPLGRSFGFAALCMAVLTVGEMLTLPMLATLISNRAPASSVGRFQGMFSLAFTVAYVIGPLLGMWVYGSWSAEALWIAVGLMAVLLWLGFNAVQAAMSKGKAT